MPKNIRTFSLGALGFEILGFGILGCLLIVNPAWSQTGPLAFDSKIDSLINQVSRENLENYIQALAEANGNRSRVSYTEGNRWGATYLKETFESFAGLSSVTFDTFFVTTASAPFNMIPLVNVIATLEGVEDSVYVVGGHLDCSASRDNTINWDTDWLMVKAQGADDNASGLAATLEIARILSNPNNEFINKHTIKFVAFGAEEYHPAYSGSHHLGSRNFAKKAFMQGLNVLGAYILDMIGFNSTGNDYFNIVSNNRSQSLGEKMLEVNSVYSIGLNSNAPRFPEATYSDHESFWLYRFKAILLIENAPPWENNLPWYTANPFYHTQNDVHATINLDQIEKVTKLTLGTVASLTGIVTSVQARQEEKVSPGDFSLFQNYPNPFNAGTLIRYQLQQPGRVKVTIYNLLGREVVSLVNKDQSSGEYSFVWDGKDSRGRELSSGIYLYALEVGNQRFVRKMILNR